ncbi:MAG: hypothetical protein QOJ07_3200 [Thermoleophilaceae bacterium]|jgi:hypothetical protein|nr:hypothetical protein [Thermoleophilaceae bacterium]
MSLVIRGIRLLSTLACLVIALSFGLFASDQGHKGSDEQVARVQQETGQTTQPVPVAPAPPKHGKLRTKIDSVNHTLVSPFAGVVSSTDNWASRGIPALLGLLLYGLLLRIGLNYLPARI